MSATDPRIDALEAAAFAIAHIAGCDEPNSNARICNIPDQIAFGQDGCECLNMARAAADAVDTRVQQLTEEVERLRRGLETVQVIGCGIPGHAVAVGCQRALAAQAVLGGWEPELWRGTVTDDAWSYAEAWVNEKNAAIAEVDASPKEDA